VSAGLVGLDELPSLVRERCGTRRSDQLGSFINAMITTIRANETVGMDARHAEALAPFVRSTTRPSICAARSRQQASSVVGMLRLGRVLQRPSNAHPDVAERTENPRANEALHDAVEYVAGMTDRYACRSAVTHLEWPIDQLPNGIDR